MAAMSADAVGARSCHFADGTVGAHSNGAGLAGGTSVRCRGGGVWGGGTRGFATASFGKRRDGRKSRRLMPWRFNISRTCFAVTPAC